MRTQGDGSWLSASFRREALEETTPADSMIMDFYPWKDSYDQPR